MAKGELKKNSEIDEGGGAKYVEGGSQDTPKGDRGE